MIWIPRYLQIRLKMASLAGLSLLGFSVVAMAHSDPWGDIHPKVSVLDGKFSIVFNSRVQDEDGSYTDYKSVYRIIHNADGTLFAPRHSLEKKRSWRENSPVGLRGTQVQLGNDTLTFGEGHGKPGYLLESPGGKRSTVRLPWPEDVSLTLFEDVCVTAEGIAITGKTGGNRHYGGPLFFYWFRHGATGPGTVVEIGPTVCIYDFPVASNVAYCGGRFWLAYMKADEMDVKLMLWSWKPGEEKGRVEALDSPGYGNSHLSMAATGNRLCIAYHCVVNEPGKPPETARIMTVFRDAE